MSAERLSMRKITEVLRLKHEAGCGNRDIAKSCGIGRTTVSRYLHRAARVGLSWALPTSLDETPLERLLFSPPPLPSTGFSPEPDLVPGPSRDEAQGYDLGAAVGGV
ncbi:hypothetical protein DFAR_3710002 [Desulfarculales bacterium]